MLTAKQEMSKLITCFEYGEKLSNKEIDGFIKISENRNSSPRLWPRSKNKISVSQVYRSKESNRHILLTFLYVDGYLWELSDSMVFKPVKQKKNQLS